MNSSSFRRKEDINPATTLQQIKSSGLYPDYEKLLEYLTTPNSSVLTSTMNNYETFGSLAEAWAKRATRKSISRSFFIELETSPGKADMETKPRTISKFITRVSRDITKSPTPTLTTASLNDTIICGNISDTAWTDRATKATSKVQLRGF